MKNYFAEGGMPEDDTTDGGVPVKLHDAKLLPEGMNFSEWAEQGFQDQEEKHDEILPTRTR